MISMIEQIEFNCYLPLIGCRSGPSKWLEELSVATNPLKSVQNLENVSYLLEESQIYGLIYPSQFPISERFFEDIYKKSDDSKPEKLKFRDQNYCTKTRGSSDVTVINVSLSKEKYKANLEKSDLHRENRKKSTYSDLKDEISHSEPNVKMGISLTEVENKYPVKSDLRKTLLRNIIDTHGRKIEDNQLGQSLDALKQVLQSSDTASIEKLKSAENIRTYYKRTENRSSSEFEQNSSSIVEEHSPARYFKNFLSEKINEQFSKHIQNISVSKESLIENSGKVTDSSLTNLNLTKSSLIESDQYSNSSFADYPIQDFKSLKPEIQLIEDDEFKIDAERVSKQFSKRIEGIATSKRFLEEKLKNNSAQNSYFSAGNGSYKIKDPEPDQLPEKIKDQFYSNQFDSNQFDSNQFVTTSVSDPRVSENNMKPDLLSLNSINMLIDRAYLNSIKKSGLNEENRELLLNLTENLSQIINQTNRDTAPKRQNIFNIQVSGESPTGENDLRNLSDRLVLILKDQARRHGIDLS